MGIEYGLGIYLTTFAVECSLELSKLEGTRLTAIFWGAFSVMRFLAIFAAMKLNPSIIMGLSFVLCIVGTVVLAVWAQASLVVLQVFTGVLGFGMASIYATGILWLEQVRLNSSFSASGGILLKCLVLQSVAVKVPISLFHSHCRIREDLASLRSQVPKIIEIGLENQHILGT